MKAKKKKVLTEEELAKFWDDNSVPDVIDAKKAKRVDLVYQPPVESISLRLPLPLLITIKQMAAKMDIAYQALIKIWLTERVKSLRQ